MLPDTTGFFSRFEVVIPLPIWQVRMDEVSNQLAIEARDADTLQNAFYVVDAANGDLVLPALLPKASWGTGLDDFYADNLYLHAGTNQKFGQPEGIICLSASNGQILWEQPGFSFYSLAAEYLLAKDLNQDSTTVVQLNKQTGALILGDVNSSTAKKEINQFSSVRQGQLKEANHYPEINAYFSELRLFLQQAAGLEVVLAIDYLETDFYFVLGYYQEQPDLKYTYSVGVYNLTGELLLHEEIKSNCTGIGLDNFFVLNKTLILIKNINTLLGCVLNNK